MKTGKPGWQARGVARRFGLLALALAASWAAAAEPGFLVKYRSAASVYLDGGAAQGLAIGDRLVVASNGQTSAELEVVFLADQSASCRVIRETSPVSAGDRATLVRRTPSASEPSAESQAPAPPPAPASPPDPVPPPDPAPSWAASRPMRPIARLRGAVSLGYSRGWDRTPAGLGFEQRTARLDLSAWDIGSQPLTFNLRFRGREDARNRGFGQLSPRLRDDRLYELSLRYEPPSERFDLEVGRIGASQFSGIGYLDGALARVRVGGPVQLGGFFGQRAELGGLVEPVAGRKYGGLVRLAPAGHYAAAGYELILAGVREFAGDEISREYLALESRFGMGRRFSLYERAELDVNRGWRQALSGRSYQLSSLALSANLRFGSANSFLLSYDNRTNYRSYLSRTIPQAIFDDFLQQGLRASLYFGPPQGLSASLNGGIRLRERETEHAYSYGGGLRHGDLFGTGAWLGVDYAGYSNRFTDGHLLTVTTGKPFGRGHYLDLGYGHTLYGVATGERRGTQWLRLSGRLQLPGGLYSVGDFQYDRGDDLNGPRGLVELGYQF